MPNRTRQADWFLKIGLLLFFAVLSPGWLVSQDASARLVIARQIWKSASVFIHTPRPERFVEAPLGSTTYFGIGQSLAFIPFDMLGFLFGKLLPVDSPLSGQLQILPLLFLYAPLVGLLWWILSTRIFQELGWNKLHAQRAALIGLLSSISLVYITQSLQEEALLAVLMSSTLFALLSWFRSRSPLHAKSLGFFFALCLLFRYNTIFGLLPLLGLLLDAIKNQKLKSSDLTSLLKNAVTAALIPISLLLLFNHWRFGSPFETGYTLHYSQLAAAGIQVWRPLQPKIAMALLFGAGKGLFVLSPPLLIGVIGLLFCFRRRFYYCIGLTFSLIASALLYSKLNGFACGGHCWGARFQVHLLPFFIPLIHEGWAILKTHVVGKIEVGMLLLLGLLFQFAAISAPESLEYAQEIGRLGDYHEELITGNRQGHLPLRLRNLVYWTQHSPIPAPDSVEPQIRNLEKHHMPNLWGYSYASYAPSKIMRSSIMNVWWFLLILSVLILSYGLLFPIKFPSSLRFSKRILDT